MALGTTKFNPASPSSYDDYTSIPTPVNEVVTLLDGALAADAYGNQGGVITSISLTDASRLPNAGWISIAAEIISYTGKANNLLTGCTRGAQSTTIAAHATRAPVMYNFTAQHLQVIIDALVALEKMFVNQTYDIGTISGATIVLSGTPVTGKKVLLFVNGQVLLDGTDFTWSGTVLTFSNGTPDNGLWYLAFYTKQ